VFGGDFLKNGFILFDWLSFTARTECVWNEKDLKAYENKITADTILEILDFDEEEWTVVERSAHGFKKRYYFNGINVHFDNPQFDGVWVEFSGQGCRAFDECFPTTWLELFKIISHYKWNITRLDVAYDDFVMILDIDNITKQIENQKYISVMDSWKCIVSDKGKTAELGSPSSEIMFRIYDKARERNREDEGHWIRWEMQLRRERAQGFVKMLLEGHEIGALFSGILNKYVRFVHPSKTDSNKQRWKTQQWWSKFVNTTEQISLWKTCCTNYNLKKVENFVYKQCGNGINTLIEIVGKEQFYKDLIKNKPLKINEKYHSLIAEYGSKKSKKEVK
jgi:DNA relaxase NicK